MLYEVITPNYLWLDEGTYDVVFYYPGRKTLARQYTIYPGLVIDVEDRLEEGESVHPLDLGPKSHVNRDERLRRDRERIERWQAAEPPPVPESVITSYSIHYTKLYEMDFGTRRQPGHVGDPARLRLPVRQVSRTAATAGQEPA